MLNYEETDEYLTFPLSLLFWGKGGEEEGENPKQADTQHGGLHRLDLTILRIVT